MPLTDEQASNIKEQILKQIENFPEDKREQIKSYVLAMNNEELEEFIIKNNLMKKEDNSTPQSNNSQKNKQTPECVMCMIANKQIESLIIYEDKDYIAALEINPASEGHILLIPKKHLKETKQLKAKALTIADKIGKHLVKQLKAENFQISTSDEMKHAIVNIIPTYKDKKLNYDRKPADKKKLQEVAIKIGKINAREPKTQIKKEKKIKTENKISSPSHMIKLSRRIP